MQSPWGAVCPDQVLKWLLQKPLLDCNPLMSCCANFFAIHFLWATTKKFAHRILICHFNVYLWWVICHSYSVCPKNVGHSSCFWDLFAEPLCEVHEVEVVLMHCPVSPRLCADPLPHSAVIAAGYWLLGDHISGTKRAQLVWTGLSDTTSWSGWESSLLMQAHEVFCINLWAFLHWDKAVNEMGAFCDKNKRYRILYSVFVKWLLCASCSVPHRLSLPLLWIKSHPFSSQMLIFLSAWWGNGGVQALHSYSKIRDSFIFRGGGCKLLLHSI